VVGELSFVVEVRRVSGDGGKRSENVGISSKKSDENSDHRKPKVSWATQIDPGLVGPNPSPCEERGMDKQVNIPAPRLNLFIIDTFMRLERFLAINVLP
jgi:hypothetical protein